MRPTLEVAASPLPPAPTPSPSTGPPSLTEEEPRDKTLEFGEGGRAELRLLVGGRYIGSRRRRRLN